MDNSSISVLIPVRNEGQSLVRVLAEINDQTVLPREIVIVDSSTNEEVKQLVGKYGDTIPVVYYREQKAYPGKARNTGVGFVRGEWVAFLDCRTIPEREWLERYCHLVQVYNADVVIGVTKFNAEASFQKTLRAATYGKIGHHSVPGTLIKKKVFSDSGGFLEHVRMGEDIEWRERLAKLDFNIHRPDQPVVIYHGMSDSFTSVFKKYVRSAYHTARLNILRNIKDAYLSLVLILSAIILPKWNYIIGGWDRNPLFIPHVTKLYLIALVFLFLAYQFVHYLFFRNISRSLFSRTLQLVLLIFVTLAVLNWNAVIAGWLEDAVLYVPHITKMYVGGVILVSILYRGIILPLKRKIEPGFLFPFRWIQVGLLGLSLDLIKAPGYILGAIISVFKKNQ